MGEKVKILLIEDNPSDARRVREMLTEAMQADPDTPRFDLVRAVKLSTGLKQLAKGDIDIILLDLTLPDGQGLETFVKIYNQAPDKPIIILGDAESETLAIEAVREGAQDYLAKGQLSSSSLVRAMHYASERKRRERVLHESAERFRLLYEKAPLAYHSLDESGRLLEVNQAWLNMLGYSREEVIGRWFGEFLPAQHTENFDQEFARFKAAGETHAEFEVKKKDGSHAIASIDGRIGYDEQGNFERTHCILHDITEQKRAEEALLQSDLRFRSLVEQTTDAVFCYEYDPPIPTSLPVEEQVGLFYEGVLVECNDAAARSYGATRAEKVIGKRLTDLFGTTAGSLDDFFRTFIQNNYRTVDLESTETLADGTRRNYLNNGHGVLEGGKLLRIWGTFRDITDRKQAEEALKESRRRLRAIFDQTFQFMGMMALDGTLIKVNQTALDFAGLEESDVIGKPFWETPWWTHSPELQEQLRDAISRAASGEFIRFEANHLAADGSLHYADFSLKPVRDEAGNVSFLVPEGRDITERVRSEQKRAQVEGALRAERDFSASLLDALLDTVFVFDPETGKALRWNKVFNEISGYTDEEISSKKAPDDWYSDRDLEKTVEEVAKLFRGEKSVVEMALITKDGRRIPTEYSAATVQDPESDSHYIIAVGRDITGRKQAEEMLQESEERYRIVSELTSDVAYAVRVEPDGTTVPEWVAGPLVRITGFTVSDLIARGGWPSLLHPDDLPLAFKHLQVHLAGESDVTEYRIVTKSGDVRWLRDYGYPLWDETQVRVVRIIGAAQDITEQKQAEEALRESEERLRSLSSVASEGIMIHEGGIILDANQAFADLSGYPNPDDLIGKIGMEVIPFTPESRQRVLSHMRTGSTEAYDIELTKPDGSTIPAETRGKEITYRGRKARLVSMRDISARRRIEEALRYHIEFERLITDISTHFINLPSEEVEDGINRALQLIGGFADVDRSYVFLFGEGGATMDNTHEWCAEGVEPQVQELKGVPTDIFPWSLERIRRSEIVHIPRVSDLPLEASAERAEFQAEGIQSLIMVPIVYSGTALGFLGLDSVRAERVWKEDIIALLRIVGEIFANALERKRAAEALATSEATLRSIFRAAPVGIGLVKDRMFQWTNETFHQMLGYAEEELKGQSARMVYPSQDEYERVGRTKYGAIAERGIGALETRFQRKDGQVIDVILSSIPLDPTDLSKGVTFTAMDITERKRAEEAVKKSRESLARTQSIAHLGGWEWNMVTRETAWSDENYRISGYEPGDFKPTFEKFMETVHPDDRDMIMQKLGDIQEGKITHDTYEYRIVLPDGTGRWLEGQLDVIFDDKGQPVTLAGTNLDITERKQAEAALHLTQFCVDRASVGIMRTGPDAQILSVNDQMCRALGYTAEELCTMHVYDIDPNFPLEKWRKHRERLRARGSDTFETVHRRKDGTTFPVEITNNYIEFQGSGFSVAFTQDITERKQAEEERERLLDQVQEQAQRVQQIIETVPEGVILLDTKNRVILANPLGHEELAVLADTLVGGTLIRLGERPLAEFLTSPPQGLWHEVTTEGQTFQVIARPIETGPTPGGWVLVIRNITQQREIERRVHQQERLAAVGQLAAGIAHDFNNIMAVISLYASMSLRTTDLPAKVYERLEIIDQQAHRASDLIQQILDFSRRAVLERLPMELGMFLKEQVKLLRRTLPEDIQIDLVVGKDEYTVSADLTRVQQMIMNLATNARDSMPEGGRLHIGLEKVWITDPDDVPLPDMAPGEWVRVTVADTGCGIPADVIPHIYDPFFTTKPAGMGTGLGLSQVYGIVKQHEGSIDVATQEGEGTTFTIYLPSLAQLKPEPVPSEVETLVQGQGQLILVVEDDAATRAALVDSLELLNYRVIETANGREALSIFEQHADQADPAQQIALILSDMVMPEMGGKALLYALRERSQTAKVILLTGHPLDQGTLEDLKPQGPQDWLLKPLSIEQLSQVVARALEEE